MKKIINEWINISYEKGLKGHRKHFFIIQDILIGLNPAKEKVIAAEKFVHTLKPSPEKDRVLLFLAGRI